MNLYIATVHGKVKPGKSKSLKARLVGHDKGNTKPVVHYLYVAEEGYEEHINNLESHIKRQLFPFLENPNGHHTPSEYVDPKFTQIDIEYVRKIAEDRIKSHPLRIHRLKSEFLPINRYNAKTIADGIKNFPHKYLEVVA